jgi:hypothetical protein
MYLFNSTEWCYIKRTTDNVLQILLQASRWRVKTAIRLTNFVTSVSVNGKNSKYDFVNTLPWKRVKSYANTPTWSNNSANSQCKAGICKKYHGY